jgi:PBP1b-binding outer membrane lipoprotein LpoB
MKTYLTIILSLLFLSGCLKDDDNTPEITIDWETYGYVMNWTEVESKTGDSDWENISEGQDLTFLSNSIDEELELPNNGIILYAPSVNINIKNNTSFERTDSTFVLYLYPDTAEADTVYLAYELSDSSTIVISDTTVNPTIEIKYRRDN